MSKTVLFQTIQFSISIQFSSVWIIDTILSGFTSLGQSGSGSDGNEGVHRIPQSCGITGTLPSDYLVSYPGHLLGDWIRITGRMDITRPYIFNLPPGLDQAVAPKYKNYFKKAPKVRNWSLSAGLRMCYVLCRSVKTPKSFSWIWH